MHVSRGKFGSPKPANHVRAASAEASRKPPKRSLSRLMGFLLSALLLAGAAAGGLFDQAGNSIAGQNSRAVRPAEQGASSTAAAAGASGIPGAPAASVFSYSDVPAYAGAASVQINGDVPFFTAADVQYAQENLGYKHFSDQDELSRCSSASACVGKETMPAAGDERGSIGMVKPSGWHTVRYESVEGKYLYNRCHLLAWQLTNENANVNNLITGTRFMNTTGMVKYEDMVAGYVRSTGNHVLYRVTPLFVENELVARGVLMEARSIEDDGAGVQFCAWAYNVQPEIAIDYRDGTSTKVALSMEMSAAAGA